MMTQADVHAHLVQRFRLDLTKRSPVEIPNTDRSTLAGLFNALGYRRGVEIGVERGRYSEVLCRENPGVELFCVDAWKAYRGYRDHVDDKKLQRFYEEAQERLAPYNVTFVRKFSLDAVKDFADASLDFVYIDGNHDFQHCTNDIAEWGKKVRPGGIIAGHDYSRYRWPNRIHVVQAVNGWTDAEEVKPWFLLGSQAKVEGQLRDDSRSWFWVQREYRSWQSGPKVHQ
jgi:SAM-dependent methyltransferase